MREEGGRFMLCSIRDDKLRMFIMCMKELNAAVECEGLASETTVQVLCS